MNTRIASFLNVVAAAGAALPFAGAAAPKGPWSVAYLTHCVVIDARAGSSIVPGDTRECVQELMGLPDRELSRDVWLYRGYHTHDRRVPDSQHCHSMLLYFEDDTLAWMLFVNSRAAAALRRDLENRTDHIARR